MNDDNVRSEFEKKHPLPAGMVWDPDRQQYFGHAEFWLYSDRLSTWIQSRQAIEIELPPLSGMNSSFVADGIQKTREHNRYNAAVKDCRKAIEAAGLKVKP